MIVWLQEVTTSNIFTCQHLNIWIHNIYSSLLMSLRNTQPPPPIGWTVTYSRERLLNAQLSVMAEDLNHELTLDATPPANDITAFTHLN